MLELLRGQVPGRGPAGAGVHCRAPACLAGGPCGTQTPEPCRLCTASVLRRVCPGCDPRAHTLDSELIGSVGVILAKGSRALEEPVR